jgi:hypothetical protein
MREEKDCEGSIRSHAGFIVDTKAGAEGGSVSCPPQVSRPLECFKLQAGGTDLSKRCRPFHGTNNAHLLVLTLRKQQKHKRNYLFAIRNHLQLHTNRHEP